MSKKVRILFVISQLGAGGSERVVLDLAKGLEPSQFDVYLVAFNSGVLEQAFRDVCKRVFLVHKKPGFDLSAMLRVSGIIAEFNIDVINAHHYMPCFYSFLGAVLLRNRRLIYTEHSVSEVDGIYASNHGRLLRWMLYRIAGVVGVSREVRDAFRKYYPMHSRKISAILNGVDIPKFSSRKHRAKVREQFRFLPEDFVIGTVANFRKVKNHACVVRAAARLKRVCPQARFLFIGTGFPGDAENSEDELRQMIAALELEDRIVLAGYRDDIPLLLSSLDVFCLPSLSEGLPVSILEAMAAMVPVIGSNVAGIREVVDSGKTGLLFASDDDEELACLIQMLADGTSFASILVDEACSYINENHAHQKFLGRYAKLFCHD